MTLTHLTLFALGALIVRGLPARFRRWALLIGSLVAMYLLQPALPLAALTFGLPTLTVILAVGGWLITRPDAPAENDAENRLTLGIVILTVCGLALFGGLSGLFPTLPAGDLLIALGGAALIFLTFGALIRDRARAIWVVLGVIVVGFAILKTEPLTVALAAWLRANAGRSLSLAGVGDLGWLGFSYVAFRLIHTLRDHQTRKLPDLTLREYLTYLIFFPAYTAGPIDRAERFVRDFRALPALDAARLVEGLGRVTVGIFKKFVVADTLAFFALNATLAAQGESTGAYWLMLYAYAFRLYFDFSGYSDIAIGIGRLYGIDLPENFNLPYLKSSLTAFWQSWHITLSTWARFYVFMPLSRALLSRHPKPSPTLVVLAAHLATMITIGLWHGVTLNFVIWGVWHGLGLFVHKLYSDRTRMFYQSLKDRPTLRRAMYIGGLVLTFHVVALGWVWFALPAPDLSLRVLGRLFGLGG